MIIEFTRVRVTRVNSPNPKVSTVLTCPIITVLYNTKHPLTLSTIQRETKSATDLAKEKNKKNEFPFFHERRYPSSLLPFRFRIRYEILLLLFFVLPRSKLHLLFLSFFSSFRNCLDLANVPLQFINSYGFSLSLIISLSFWLLFFICG